MKELRDSESSVNSLHRQLSTLSRMLAEARSLLEDKKNVLDLEDYFKKCEVSILETQPVGCYTEVVCYSRTCI